MADDDKNRISPATNPTSPPRPDMGPLSSPSAPSRAWPGGAALPREQRISPSVTNTPGPAPASMPQPPGRTYDTPYNDPLAVPKIGTTK